MQLVDTHTHIYLPEFDNDRDEAIERAVKAGVVKLLMPNIDSSSIGRMLDTENRYPGICHPMIGLHPTSVSENYLQELETMENEALSRKFQAVGEIGIDLYWDKTHLIRQIEVFKRQVAMAISSGKRQTRRWQTARYPRRPGSDRPRWYCRTRAAGQTCLLPR